MAYFTINTAIGFVLGWVIGHYGFPWVVAQIKGLYAKYISKKPVAP